MEFVIVTGVSGSGKSCVVKALEDIGFFCVDNIPPALLPKFAELCYEQEGEIERVAMGIDIRGGKLFDTLFTKYPANCIRNITFSTTVWSDNTCDSIMKIKHNLICKGFESMYFNTL